MSQVFCCGSNTALGNSGTTYQNLFGAGLVAWNGVAANRAFVMPCAGVLKNMRIQLTLAPAGTATRTFTIVTGTGVTPTALTLPFGGGLPDFDLTDSTHTVTVAAGDIISLQHVATNTPLTASARWSIEFVPTVATDVIYGGGGGGTALNTGAQRFMGLLCGGSEGNSATENSHSHLSSVSATITALYIALATTPGASKSWLFQIYKNGSAETSSNLTLTGTTGNITGLSIAVSPGDRLSLSATPSGSPASTTAGVGVLMTAGTEGESIIPGTSTDSPSTLVTEFNCPSTPQHTVDTWITTEANDQVICGPTGFSMRDLRVTFATAPGVGTSYTYTMNVNGTPSSLSAAISGAATSNTDSHSVSCVNGDLLSMQSVPASTPTGPGVNKWSMVQFVAPPSSGVTIPVFMARARQMGT